MPKDGPDQELVKVRRTLARPWMSSYQSRSVLMMETVTRETVLETFGRALVRKNSANSHADDRGNGAVMRQVFERPIRGSLDFASDEEVSMSEYTGTCSRV